MSDMDLNKEIKKVEKQIKQLEKARSLILKAIPDSYNLAPFVIGETIRELCFLKETYQKFLDRGPSSNEYDAGKLLYEKDKGD